MIEITPILDHSRGEALYIQLYKHFKQEIQAGKIEVGERLPSKRKLSVHLGISQHTIETAYQQLNAEGYVESKPRKGIFVKELNQDLFPAITPVISKNKGITKSENEQYKVDFSHGKIALEYFPYSTWRTLTVQSLYDDQNMLLLNGDRQGEIGLREEIAKYLYQSRGVHCLPDQIIIGAGTQYLLGLLIMLIGRDKIFSMEEPGFHRAREVFKDQGVVFKAISLDEGGINIDHLLESKANVAYVTPSHQFPNGMTMPIARRLTLLKWAKESDSYIIEDDYDGEFRYKGKPIPSLQGLDYENEKVIYLGTFSKSLMPSIRLSYMVLPTDLLERYKAHYTIYKQTVSRLHQHTLYHFMRDGHWERHLNKMRTSYRKKRKTLIHSISKHFGNDATITGEESGLHILLSVQNKMSEKELIENALAKQVKVYPTSLYFDKHIDDGKPKILLGFAGLKETEIEQGIQLLKDAWKNNG